MKSASMDDTISLETEGREELHVEELIEADERGKLERTWGIPPGILGWFGDTRHTTIGRRYIITAFIFFLLGGIEALLMRIQLSRPENTFLGPDLYNQIFTTHGTTMMFLFAVPVMEGMMIYLVPLMLGTRNVAFPKLNAYGYFLYLMGGLLLYGAFLLKIGPDVGWFAYVPLAGPEFSPGKRVDIWAQMITFTEMSALIGAVVTITTIFRQRAPGMTLNRMPLFVWAELVSAFMIIFAMPAIMLSSSMLAMDRLVGTQFFNQAEGGDPLLWQHLFWFFGHPEVYIIFIPALGMVSMIVTTFTRRPVFGYTAMVLSLVATAFIGFGLWVHHMFATGLPKLGASFFTAASIMIAIPSGVQIFCWIATIRAGRLELKSPFLYVLGFFGIFVLGGLSGVMIASVPFDTQVHDTFFIVAHFHYVLIGGAVFPLFGAIHYWFPKMSGRMLDEALARWSFALLFTGFNLVFFPMHQLGLNGMPRRVYTYMEESGWGDLNLLATGGGVVMGIGILLFIINVVKSIRSGALAGMNPWGADTLEWSTASPPPPYNYHYLPTVNGRNPLWDERPDQPVIGGLETEHREVLVTTALDTVPHHRSRIPGSSVWPIITAVATGATLLAVIFTPWALPAGMILVGLALLGCYFRKDPKSFRDKSTGGSHESSTHH
jgi:cytochrome c oxidase subunit 1